jgi:hypothetical protein
MLIVIREFEREPILNQGDICATLISDGREYDMKEIEPFVIKLSDNVGDLLSSTEPIEDKRFLLCDGRKISRAAFPELFNVYGTTSCQMQLPDYSTLLPDRMFFYIIVRKA